MIEIEFAPAPDTAPEYAINTWSVDSCSEHYALMCEHNLGHDVIERDVPATARDAIVQRLASYARASHDWEQHPALSNREHAKLRRVVSNRLNDWLNDAPITLTQVSLCRLAAVPQMIMRDGGSILGCWVADIPEVADLFAAIRAILVDNLLGYELPGGDKW